MKLTPEEALKRLAVDDSSLISLNLSSKFESTPFILEGKITNAATVFGKVLRKNKTLRFLSFDHNKIGDVGSEAFANVLKENPNLLYLDLNYSHITDNGAVTIARSLAFNTTMIELDMSFNNVNMYRNPHTGKCYPESVCKSIDIDEIYDHYNKELSASSLTVFANILKKNRTLTSLNIGGYNIGDQTYQTFIDALKNNYTIINISLGRVIYDEEFARRRFPIEGERDPAIWFGKVQQSSAEKEMRSTIRNIIDRNIQLRTQLLYALEKIDITTAYQLIRQGISVCSAAYTFEGHNFKNYFGPLSYSPLMIAAKVGNLELTNLILQYDSYPEAKTPPRKKSLRPDIDIYTTIDLGKNALQMAQERGHTEVARAIAKAMGMAFKDEKAPTSRKVKLASPPPPSFSTSEPTVTVAELSRWRSVFKEREQEFNALAAWRQRIGFSLTQFEALLTRLADIPNLTRALETEVIKLNNELDMHDESQRQRAYILQRPKLMVYYQTVRHLHYLLLAAKVVTSGKVDQADDTMDLIIHTGAELGQKHLPIWGMLVSTLEKACIYGNGIRKSRAMRRLAEWTPDNGDRLAEQFARRLTFAKEDDIENPQQSFNQHPAKGLINKICATGKAVYQGAVTLKDKAEHAYQEAKEGRKIAAEERLALADTAQVLEKIMTGEIVAETGLLDAAQRDKQVDKMLSVFKLSKPAVVAVSSILASSSISLSSSTRPQAGSQVLQATILSSSATDLRDIQKELHSVRDSFARQKAEEEKIKEQHAAEISRMREAQERQTREHEHVKKQLTEMQAVVRRLAAVDEEDDNIEPVAIGSQIQLHRSAQSGINSDAVRVHSRKQLAKVEERVRNLEGLVEPMAEQMGMSPALAPVVIGRANQKDRQALLDLPDSLEQKRTRTERGDPSMLGSATVLTRAAATSSQKKKPKKLLVKPLTRLSILNRQSNQKTSTSVAHSDDRKKCCVIM